MKISRAANEMGALIETILYIRQGDFFNILKSLSLDYKVKSDALNVEESFVIN